MHLQFLKLSMNYHFCACIGLDSFGSLKPSCSDLEWLLMSRILKDDLGWYSYSCTNGAIKLRSLYFYSLARNAVGTQNADHNLFGYAITQPTQKMATPSGKGGYDCQFVDPPSKTLECPVCLLTLRDPHVTTCCGNYLCEPCFLRVLADRGSCPLCNDAEFNAFLHKGVQREINALKVRCVHQDQGCEWVGELGYLQQHLLPSSGGRDGCGYEEEECRYQCGGRFQRRLLEDHENDKCPMRPLEMQFHSLTRKLEVENQQLKEKLVVMKNKLEAENQQLKEDLVVVNRKLHDFEAENQTLREESKQMKLEMMKITHAQEKLMSRINKIALEHVSQEELSRIKLKQEKEIKALEKETKAKFVLLEVGVNPSPPFYFTISNFLYYKKNSLRWDSQPFYSHPGGYKLKLQVWPNGFKSCKGTHVSVFVAVMRGENDDQLKWPFTGEVTVRLLNLDHDGHAEKAGHWDKTIHFGNSVSLKFRCKPEGCYALTSLGHPNFVSHSDLPYNAGKNTAYVRDNHNQLQFVVTKVELIVAT